MAYVIIRAGTAETRPKHGEFPFLLFHSTESSTLHLSHLPD